VAKRWVVTVVIAAVLLVGAVAVARAIRDDPAATPGASSPTEAPIDTGTAAASSTPAPAPAPPSPTTAAPTASTTGPPGPCGVDTGAIRAVIDAGVPDAAANADVASCRLAASDPSWASVQLAARAGAPFDPPTVFVHGGAGSWGIVATGGAEAGCGRAPQAVIVDLGQFCAGAGEGGA
jgi:hypothetical protein